MAVKDSQAFGKGGPPKALDGRAPRCGRGAAVAPTGCDYSSGGPGQHRWSTAKAISGRSQHRLGRLPPDRVRGPCGGALAPGNWHLEGTLEQSTSNVESNPTGVPELGLLIWLETKSSVDRLGACPYNDASWDFFLILQIE